MNSVQDALVLQEVRRVVGDQIELRVDANCRWTFEEAITFGLLVKKCNLQYIEVWYSINYCNLIVLVLLGNFTFFLS